MRRILSVFLFFAVAAAWAQEHDPGFYPDAIRGEVWVDLEPIYGDRADSEYPLSQETAARRALQEAALYYSAMIYGWSFHYDIGERARGIAEDFDVFEPMGEIPWGDPRMSVTEVETRGMTLRIWTDYRLNETQQRRILRWRTGTVRNAQSIGYCPLEGPTSESLWLDIRHAALKDAARAAVRQMLRGSERNRPKEASGYISLASFPRFFIDSGRWTAVARFRVQINEIVPFAAY
ncbi:MAG: hypothetical protein FWG46_04505 [Treponema sp.]|jgi:hypothetical protein|nr:hypothetical protein [Treponema sp.]